MLSFYVFRRGRHGYFQVLRRALATFNTPAGMLNSWCVQPDWHGNAPVYLMYCTELQVVGSTPCWVLVGPWQPPLPLRFRMTFQTNLPRCSSWSRDSPRVFCFTFFTPATGKIRIATRNEIHPVYWNITSRNLYRSLKFKHDWIRNILGIRSFSPCYGLR